MTSPWWNDDDELLRALGGALRAGQEVPQRFVEMGRAAYTWHDIDAELATLTFDSATAAHERMLATTRAEPAALRSLTFAAGRLSLHLEVTNDALHGQVVPAQPGEIELRPADGPPTSIEVDEVGWFVVRPVPTGTFRLRCQTTSGTLVITDWITL
ncbi:MAG: hypothetical protein QOE03_3703 [Micromonosporaceae bacterium]|nr:hypothetical protein [Micromonosporaceae bacterium]